MIQVDFKLIDSILEKYECQKTKVIPIMQDIQKEYKFLPKDALLYVADKVGESPAELYGIATFYENFSMNEKGKYVIKVCNGHRLPCQKIRRCTGGSLRSHRYEARGSYVRRRAVYN